MAGTPVTGSFTATGVSLHAQNASDGEFAYAITGTFVGKVYLERSVTPSRLAWEKVAGPFTAPCSGTFHSQDEAVFRLDCTSRTSGTINYTLTPAVPIPVVPFTPSAVASLNVTGNISQAGTAVIGTNIAGAGGLSAGPAIVLTTTVDPSTFPSFVRNNQFQTTLNPSVSTSNIWENFISSVQLNGPGAMTAEVNAGHAYIGVSAGASFSTGENFETSFFNSGTVNSSAQYTVLYHNASTGTTGTNVGVHGFLTNDNTTPGSVGTYKFIDMDAMGGGGSLPTTYYFLFGGDANAASSIAGQLWVGNVGVGQAMFGVKGASTSHYSYNTQWENSGGTQVSYLTNDGALAVGAYTLANLHAMLSISDVGGTSTFGTHVSVDQTTAPGITNATLDAKASDVAGTLTLTAANPVLTFHVAYATVPHVVISSPSGTAFTYVVTINGITFTGGATGNTVTYHAIQ